MGLYSFNILLLFSLIYKHQEQQEAIDSIENNIDNAQVNVHEGTRQLGKVCFWIMLVKAFLVKCRSVACIDSLDQHRDWKHDQYSVDTWSTLDQQSVNSKLSVNRLICINQRLVNSPDLNGVLMECQPRCLLSVNWVSIKCQWRVSMLHNLTADALTDTWSSL